MTTLALARPFFGRRIIAAAFLLAVFGWGVGFYGPPVYLQAVVERAGWPIALVSAAVTAHFLIGALIVANLPLLYRVIGVAAITGAAAALLALGVLGWAVARAPWQLFAAALVSGVGWAGMGGAAVNAIIAPWFVRTRPAALSMAYNGASIGGVVFSPLWVALIGALGFASAAALVGGAMVLTIAVLSTLAFSQTPERLGQTADGDAPGRPSARVTSPLAKTLPGRLLWRDRRFLTLAAGMALGLFAQIGLLAHLFSLLTPVLGAQGAGLTMGLATGCAVAGRSLVGWLMPEGADRRLVACASYAVQVLSSFVFITAAGDSVPLLILGAALFGAGIGNATSLPPLIAQVEFVKEDVQRVVSLIVAIGQGTYAFAPAAFGLFRAIDAAVRPDDASLFVAAAFVQGLAILCFLAGRHRG